MDRVPVGSPGEWLGGRDSNPDTQIQSPIEALDPQQDQALRLAEFGELQQDPQRGRNAAEWNFEEDTLPMVSFSKFIRPEKPRSGLITERDLEQQKLSTSASKL